MRTPDRAFLAIRFSEARSVVLATFLLRVDAEMFVRALPFEAIIILDRYLLRDETARKGKRRCARRVTQ